LLSSELALTAAAKGTYGEYELIILHHSHFLIGGPPVLIRHPVTQTFTFSMLLDTRMASYTKGVPMALPFPHSVPEARSTAKFPSTLALSTGPQRFGCDVSFVKTLCRDPHWIHAQFYFFSGLCSCMPLSSGIPNNPMKPHSGSMSRVPSRRASICEGGPILPLQIRRCTLVSPLSHQVLVSRLVFLPRRWSMLLHHWKHVAFDRIY
jgi:hypothetical protein